MIPTGKHTDFYWPLSLIPRKWTARASDKKPVGVGIRFSSKSIWIFRFDANESDPDSYDVPVDREAILSLSRYGFMLSINTHGWLFRIGTMRYDYVDKYYQIPTLALKRHR